MHNTFEVLQIRGVCKIVCTQQTHSTSLKITQSLVYMLDDFIKSPKCKLL